MTGGCYLEPKQSGFSNTFHLYLWIALLGAPFVLHLAASPSKVALGIYCGLIALLFTAIKTINYRLHVMFEDGEIIHQSNQAASFTKDKTGAGTREHDESELMLSVSPGRRYRVQGIQLTEFSKDNATPPVHHSSWQSILDPGVSDDSDLPTNPKDAEELKEKDFRRLTATQEHNVTPNELPCKILLPSRKEIKDQVLGNATPLMPYDSPVCFHQSINQDIGPSGQEQCGSDIFEESHLFLPPSDLPSQSAVRPLRSVGKMGDRENTEQSLCSQIGAVPFCAVPADSKAAVTEMDGTFDSPKQQVPVGQFITTLNQDHQCPDALETECSLLVINAGNSELEPTCNMNIVAGENTSCGKYTSHCNNIPGNIAGQLDCGDLQPACELATNLTVIRIRDPNTEKDDQKESEHKEVPTSSNSCSLVEPTEGEEIEVHLDKDSTTCLIHSVEAGTNENNSIQDTVGTMSLPNMQEPDLLDIPVIALELPEAGKPSVDTINNTNLKSSSFLYVNVSKGIQVSGTDKPISKSDLVVRPKSSCFVKQALSIHQYDRQKSRKQMNVGADSSHGAGNENWATTAPAKGNKSEDEDTNDHTTLSRSSSLLSHHNISMDTSSSTNSQSSSSPDHTYHNYQNPYRQGDPRAVSESFLKVMHCLIENQRQQEQQAVADGSLRTHIRVFSMDGGADVVLSRASRGGNNNLGRTLTSSKSDLEAKEGQIPNESNFIEFISLLESINSSRMNAAGWASDCREEGAMGGGTFYVTLGCLCHTVV